MKFNPPDPSPAHRQILRDMLALTAWEIRRRDYPNMGREIETFEIDLEPIRDYWDKNWSK